AGSDGTLKISSATVNFNTAGASLPDTLTVNQTGGYISGSGSVTIGGTFDWSAGTVNIAGAGGVTTAGTTNLDTASQKIVTGATWTNAGSGTVNWNMGDISLSNSAATLNNNGIFNIATTDPSYDLKGTGTFNNNADGIINKVGTDTTVINSTTFTNAGLVDVDTDTLQFTIPTTVTGSFDIASGATVNFATATHTIATATPVAAESSGTVKISGGTLNFNSAGTGIPSGVTINQTGGIIGGTGDLTINGTFDWTTGTISISGAGGLTTAGTTNLDTAGQKTVTGATWTNTDSGTVNWNMGDVSLSNGSSVFNNNGIFNIDTTDPVYDLKGTGTFNNNADGVVNKIGTDTTVINPTTFTNAGLVDVDTDMLQFTLPTTVTGSFDIASGATVYFSANVHTIATATPVAAGSSGTLKIASGTLNFNAGGTSLPDTLTVNQISGTIGGDGDLTINGTFDWDYGTVTIAGAGGLTTAGTTNLDTAGQKTVNGATWTNAGSGTVNWNDGDISLSNSSSVFNNNGTFNIVTADINDDIRNYPGVFNNNAGGILRKVAASTGNIYIQCATVTNEGTVDVDGGTLVIGPSLTNNGTLEVDTGAAFQVNGATFTNAADGTIRGTGTLNLATPGLTNSGNVNPGTSAGALSVTGDYSQTSEGTLNIELGGTTPGTDFDQLSINGSSSLAGTLNVMLISPFDPGGGDIFQIIDYTSLSGTFDALNLPELTGGKNWNVDYG
ncbi:beta strand repeat-containing protein, partial [Thermodesulfobacteriota bacterium]